MSILIPRHATVDTQSYSSVNLRSRMHLFIMQEEIGEGGENPYFVLRKHYNST